MIKLTSEALIYLCF